MIIDLIKLEESPYEFNVKLTPEEIDLDSESARLVGETSVDGAITRQIAETTVAGRISAALEIECSRCLTLVSRQLSLDFQDRFIAAEHDTEVKEAELLARDLDVSVIENEQIDLAEIVREQILLNLPEQIFCREGCRGLCPKCGANRNEKDCRCEQTEIDPRWAALKNLK